MRSRKPTFLFPVTKVECKDVSSECTASIFTSKTNPYIHVGLFDWLRLLALFFHPEDDGSRNLVSKLSFL
jgi:hypothetical protein